MEFFFLSSQIVIWSM